MIDIDTVFILGAGASRPYGYPTGRKLRDYICTDFNTLFPNILKNSTLPGLKAQIVSETEQFTKIFKNSSTLSIDLFLARNPHFSDIGKLAIILSIFDAERISKFREDIQKPEQDWYGYLYNRMTDSLNEPNSYINFGNNKVTFITFNYDRSLEYFFYESLKNSFNSAPDDKIVEELKKIPIFHVYGKITDLPWEGNTNNGIDYLEPDDEPYRRFGFDFLQKLKSNIKIVYEIEQHDCSAILDKISDAKRIFFLGFGYASENLEILSLHNTLRNDQLIYGTALGFLEKEIEDIRSSLRLNFEGPTLLLQNPRIRDVDCVRLLREFL